MIYLHQNDYDNSWFTKFEDVLAEAIVRNRP